MSPWNHVTLQRQVQRRAAQVVAGQNDNVVHHPVLDVLQHPVVLPHRVGGALEPLLILRSLSGR